MKLHLISNMYPSEKNSTYGRFVQKTYEQLSHNSIKLSKTVLYKENNKYKKLFNYFIFYFKIITKLLLFKFDVVYVHYISHCAIPLLVVMKLKKINLVVNIHGSDVTSEKEKDVKLNVYTKVALEYANKVIVPSKYMQEFIIDKYHIDSKKVLIYPSGGVDETVFYPENNDVLKKKILTQYNIDYNKKIMTYVSRIDDGKGWDLFLKSLMYFKGDLEFLDNWEILIIGSGSREKELLELVEKLRLFPIKRIPSLDKFTLSDIYKASDWVVFPSELPESLGLVGLESLACGTPVIGTNFAGISTYLFDEYNGLTFERGNVEELSFAIRKAISMDVHEYKKITFNAIKSSEKYLSKNVKLKILDILLE